MAVKKEEGDLSWFIRKFRRLTPQGRAAAMIAWTGEDLDDIAGMVEEDRRHEADRSTERPR